MGKQIPFMKNPAKNRNAEKSLEGWKDTAQLSAGLYTASGGPSLR